MPEVMTVPKWRCVVLKVDVGDTAHNGLEYFSWEGMEGCFDSPTCGVYN